MDTSTLALTFWDFYWLIFKPTTWLALCSVLAVYYLFTSRFGLTLFSVALAMGWYGLYAFIKSCELPGPVIPLHFIIVVPVFCLLIGCTSTLMAVGSFVPHGPWLWNTLWRLSEKDRALDQIQVSQPNTPLDHSSEQQQADCVEREQIKAINQAAIAIQQARLAAGQKPESSSAQ